MNQKSTRFCLAAIVWAATIFLTSSTFIERSIFINFVKPFLPPGMPQHLWINFWAGFGIFVVKTYHIAEYALLCYLLFLVFKTIFNDSQCKALFIAATFALIYAASDEWHQTFVPGRGGTWVDVVIDCVGIGLASAFVARKIKQQTLDIHHSN